MDEKTEADYKQALDVMAARNTELKGQLELMTGNRAEALQEAERRRDRIQELEALLLAKEETVEGLEGALGNLKRDLMVSAGVWGSPERRLMKLSGFWREVPTMTRVEGSRSGCRLL